MAADDHAIVVGINAYSRLTPLRGAEADALAMREWLVDPSGGAIPGANCTTILSSDYPAPTHPTKAKPMADDVRAEIERLIEDGLPSERYGRRLYLYLAGHGFAPSVDESALLMANASLAVLHHLPCVGLANEFRASTLFDEVVLVMDCCRDHYTAPVVPNLGIPSIRVPHASPAYFFALATRWSFKTRESTDPNGTVRGHFTRALLEALRAPGASSATVPDAVDQRVREFAGSKGFYRPDFRCSPAQILFGGPEPAPRRTSGVEVVFAAPAPGVRLRVLDSDEAIVGEARMAESPWRLPLPRGLYELTRSDRPKHRQAFRVGHEGFTHVAA